jgi:hypothetical protein
MVFIREAPQIYLKRLRRICYYYYYYYMNFV